MSESLVERTLLPCFSILPRRIAWGQSTRGGTPIGWNAMDSPMKVADEPGRAFVLLRLLRCSFQ